MLTEELFWNKLKDKSEIILQKSISKFNKCGII